MDLAERGGGEGFGIEEGEGLGKANAELGEDDALDLVEGERGDVVVKAGECGLVSGGQQVGAAGEDLAELDERGPHTLQIVGELFGAAGLGGGGGGRAG